MRFREKNAEKKLIQTLYNVINELEKELSLKDKLLKQEREKNTLYINDICIILKNESENRKLIKDLENHVKLLTDNLSEAKKKQLGL